MVNRRWVFGGVAACVTVAAWVVATAGPAPADTGTVFYHNTTGQDLVVTFNFANAGGNVHIQGAECGDLAPGDTGARTVVVKKGNQLIHVGGKIQIGSITVIK